MIRLPTITAICAIANPLPPPLYRLTEAKPASTNTTWQR
ncbi:hypothetical protein TERTU_4250 [Teredinibacter turnerae T7901]|uniref:Uncharacterized protein n=1 Tax=Teredinibacter turnerae (strain ATCC 39867 / T7901) TaxID=377629 RepID=C5BI74_TERTT|nr:hypothetical protein TERTU_4250 [Teredinibacter turnerae T7901]